jgi:PKD repeat protein
MIDWGDGIVVTNTGTSPSHTYATAGDYTIKISGIRAFSNFG